MNWSPQQDRALAQVSAWMRDPSRQVFRLFGYAGTGKTTLAKHLVSNARRTWLFAAFTGKAAHVLRTKGCEGASTIHSLIYRPAGQTKDREIALLETRLLGVEAKYRALVEQEDRSGTPPIAPDETDTSEERAELARQSETLREQIRQLESESETRYALWTASMLADPSVDGVVIDECSMVDTQIGTDLLSFDKKILVLGDPAQLPPVGGGGFFTNHEPDVLLTEVHRHARESGILRLATHVREGGHVGSAVWGEDCRVLDDAFLHDGDKANIMLAADQVLVGRNRTRRKFNLTVRKLTSRERLLEPNDRLVCLKNDRGLGVYNGSQWLVQGIDEIDSADKTATLTLRSEDDESSWITAPVWLHHVLGDKAELESMGWDRLERAEFDYSYALTVHKAQGSQWGRVVLCDESGAFRQDARRWLYTGITRASRELTVIL